MLKRLRNYIDNSRIGQHVTDGPLDAVFLILVMTLLTIGTVMMFSASYVYAAYNRGDSFYFLKRQLIFVVLGLTVMFVVSRIKFDIWKKAAIPLAIASVFLLLLVLVYHTDVEGSDESFKRWMEIPFIKITFQPSDIAKISLIIFLAYYIEKHQKGIEKDWRFMLRMLGFIAVACGLIILEKHLSATILVAGIGFIMTYLGGANKKWHIIIIVAVVVVAFIVIKNMEIMPGYIQERLKGWLDKDYDPTGSRWQTNQSLYAIGSGGLFGTGLGGSKQKHLYLPEPQNDFIFAIVCEELGYLRTVGIIILFALFIWRGFKIGMRTKDRFASLVVMGIITQVGLQTILNIGVVTGFLPNTGISLPFFSYGGTALITLLAEMGIVLSASRGLKKEI